MNRQKQRILDAISPATRRIIRYRIRVKLLCEWLADELKRLADERELIVDELTTAYRNWKGAVYCKLHPSVEITRRVATAKRRPPEHCGTPECEAERVRVRNQRRVPKGATVNTKPPDGWQQFTDERAITRKVAEGRGYHVYTPENRKLQEAWSPERPGQQGSVTGIANQGPGTVIPRNPPSWWPDAAPMSAEIRADDGSGILDEISGVVGLVVDRRPKWHHHDKAYPGEARRHFRERHVKKYHPDGEPDGRHSHLRFAKYAHMPSPLVEVTYEHDHAEDYAGEPKIRVRHEELEHDGDVVSGRHSHEIEVKGQGEAARIDVHPFLTREDFENASLVYFCIEGCAKSDSILSAGGVVFSVPAVGQWDPPGGELERFAECLDGTVLIVCDADARENDQVLIQAFSCRRRLEKCGLTAHVVAPPDGRDADGELRWKGVDDFLVADDGGTLDELVELSRELPPALDEKALRQRYTGRSDAVERDIEVFRALAEVQTDHGTVQRGLGALSRLLSPDEMRTERGRKRVSQKVGRAIDSLRDRGDITITEGSLDTTSSRWKLPRVGAPWRVKAGDWEDKPTIMFKEEFRAGWAPRKTVRRITAEAKSKENSKGKA